MAFEKTVTILQGGSYSVTNSYTELLDKQPAVYQRAFSHFSQIIEEAKHKFYDDLRSKLQENFTEDNYGKNATIKVDISLQVH